MNRWKLAFFATLGLLLISNTCWLYAIVDSAVSYTYLESSYESERRATENLGKVIVRGASQYTKSDVLHLLREAKPNAFIVDNGTSIDFDGITFLFKSDRLTEVRAGP